jgi:hypothetical protein
MPILLTRSKVIHLSIGEIVYPWNYIVSKNKRNLKYTCPTFFTLWFLTVQLHFH